MHSISGISDSGNRVGHRPRTTTLSTRQGIGHPVGPRLKLDVEPRSRDAHDGARHPCRRPVTTTVAAREGCSRHDIRIGVAPYHRSIFYRISIVNPDIKCREGGRCCRTCLVGVHLNLAKGRWTFENHRETNPGVGCLIDIRSKCRLVTFKPRGIRAITHCPRIGHIAVEHSYRIGGFRRRSGYHGIVPPERHTASRAGGRHGIGHHGKVAAGSIEPLAVDRLAGREGLCHTEVIESFVNQCRCRQLHRGVGRQRVGESRPVNRRQHHPNLSVLATRMPGGPSRTGHIEVGQFACLGMHCSCRTEQQGREK